MKRILGAIQVVIWLAAFGAAQSVDITIAKNTVSLKNSGNQEIITLIATISATPDPSMKSSMPGATMESVLAHEWYFKAHGLAIGSSETMPLSNSAGKVTVRFVQYADGSTWGSGGDSITSQRPNVLAFLNKLSSTTNDDDFVSVLNSPQPSGSLTEAKAQTLQTIYGQYGIAPTRASVADSLNAAKSRSF